MATDMATQVSTHGDDQQCPPYPHPGLEDTVPNVPGSAVQRADGRKLVVEGTRCVPLT